MSWVLVLFVLVSMGDLGPSHDGDKKTMEEQDRPVVPDS